MLDEAEYNRWMDMAKRTLRSAERDREGATTIGLVLRPSRRPNTPSRPSSTE
ncbi:MAG: hypothetical protein TU35_007215 [Thermoproteus sp. AZ2]|uniref:Uncharacterized protein n=1 Tax=Thermoproteus sp. AZ2 TaxID=1609232 RepID=A0ACC6V236_9CREN